MTEVKRPLVRYHGSKWLIAPWIISFIPNSDGDKGKTRIEVVWLKGIDEQGLFGGEYE